MKKFYLTLLILAFLSMGFSIRTDNIANGDQYFQKMKYREALYFYLMEPENYEAQWKISRTYIIIADTAHGTLKKQYILRAEQAARKSVTLNEHCGYAHTWLAAALGNKAVYEGSKEKIRLCNSIQSELNRAIELNTKDDVAYSILGTFYRQLGSISWVERQLAETFLGAVPKGGYAESEQYLKKSIELSPTTIRHWYELGLTYQAWGKKELARSSFLKVKALTPQVYSDHVRVKHVEALLKES